MRFAALGGFELSQARPQQAPLVGAALVVVVPSVAAWAALVHQQAPFVGAALVALARSGHQQALGWAALVTSVPQGYWSGWQDSGLVSSQALG